jgi:hypothetical protein
MHTTRRIAVLTAAALLSSCSSNSSNGSVPQLQTSDATAGTAVFTSVDKESGGSVPAVKSQLAAGEVNAGPGYSDVSPHQIVRTSRNVVYIAVPACISYPTCFGNSLKMQAGNKAGNPTSFTEQDAAHHPQTSASARDAIGTSAMAIDGNDVIWVGYNTRNLWGRSFRMGTTSAGGGWVTQGKEGVGMAVEENGKPHIVFSFIGTDKQKHIATAQTQGSAWSDPVQIDDTKLGTGQGALHPTVAYTPKNVMLVAWLVGDENVQYNYPDGTIHVRAITSLTNSAPSVEIPDTNYQGQKGYAATVIDQGPSLLVTADGVAHVSYIDTTDAIRYWSTNGTNYTSWNGSHQPAHQLSHDPSLGPDGSGGLYIYGHGTPAGGPNGHGNNMYRMHLASGSSTWGAFEEQIVDNNIDCSVSTRWSQFFDYFPTQIDYTYWDDEYPNEEYDTNH